MRQWAQTEDDNTPYAKRRPRGSCGLSPQELFVNTLQLLTRSPGDEDAPPVRLSRHIPQREGMDMSVASYNLTTATNVNVTTGTTTSTTMASNVMNATGLNTSASGTGGGNGNAGGAGQPRSATNTSSGFTSFSESIVSDDSSYVTSIYNEVLAEQVSSENSQKHRKIGGDVLRFDGAPSLSCSRDRFFTGGSSSDANIGVGRPLHHSRRCGGNGGRIVVPSPLDEDRENRCGPSSMRSNGSPLSLSMKRLNPVKFTTQRVLYTNPERVLDAPEFPRNAEQLLHWGSNNRLIIGLKNSLYGWNAETTQASRIVQLQEEMNIRAVHWLHKCTCVALALGEGTTAIYDCRSEEFLRTVRVRVPEKVELTRLAVNGPLLAVGTSTACGGVYVFDLRAKHALVSVFEGHTGGITSLQYCNEEPFYLATGGADGAVRVWDARRSSCPRYAFDRVHNGAVRALLWNPDKRSKMYTGGDDAMLCYVDTHAPMTNVPMSISRGDEEGPNSDAHYVTRAINTIFPVSGIVSPPGTGELATSHREKGHIQVRNAANFHLIGNLNAPNCNADIVCPTIAPDMQRVCAAQDETLKFWRIFGPPQTLRRTKSATPPPVSLLENELR